MIIIFIIDKNEYWTRKGWHPLEIGDYCQNNELKKEKLRQLYRTVQQVKEEEIWFDRKHTNKTPFDRFHYRNQKKNHVRENS